MGGRGRAGPLISEKCANFQQKNVIGQQLWNVTNFGILHTCAKFFQKLWWESNPGPLDFSSVGIEPWRDLIIVNQHHDQAGIE